MKGEEQGEESNKKETVGEGEFLLFFFLLLLLCCCSAPPAFIIFVLLLLVFGVLLIPWLLLFLLKLSTNSHCNYSTSSTPDGVMVI